MGEDDDIGDRRLDLRSTTRSVEILNLGPQLVRPFKLIESNEDVFGWMAPEMAWILRALHLLGPFRQTGWQPLGRFPFLQDCHCER